MVQLSKASLDSPPFFLPVTSCNAASLTMASAFLGQWSIASRVAASLLGSYAFMWGFTTLGIALLVLAGMPYNEAQTLLYLLAFLVFLATFCWTFVAASVARAWVVLGGGGAVMTLAAWALARSLL